MSALRFVMATTSDIVSALIFFVLFAGVVYAVRVLVARVTRLVVVLL